MKKYLVARTFKKKGSAAVPLEVIPDVFVWITELEKTAKRKAEFLLLSCESEAALENAWPEYGPFQIAEDCKSFLEAMEEKMR